MVFGQKYQIYMTSQDDIWPKYNEKDRVIVIDNDGISVKENMEEYNQIMHFWIYKYPHLLEISSN